MKLSKGTARGQAKDSGRVPGGAGWYGGCASAQDKPPCGTRRTSSFNETTIGSTDQHLVVSWSIRVSALCLAPARHGSGLDVTADGYQGGETLHEFQRLQVLPIRLPSEFVLAATTQAGISVVGPRYPYQQLIWNQYGGLTTTYCDPWG